MEESAIDGRYQWYKDEELFGALQRHHTDTILHRREHFSLIYGPLGGKSAPSSSIYLAIRSAGFAIDTGLGTVVLVHFGSQHSRIIVGKEKKRLLVAFLF